MCAGSPPRWFRPGVAGTEPAAIFRPHDGGQTRNVRWRSARRARGIVLFARGGLRTGIRIQWNHIYAAVEQGGLLRSDDRGESWRLVEGSSGWPRTPPEGFVHPDVHSVDVLPSSPDGVVAATGGGFYRSDDAGRTWTYLYRCYCRAAWIDPAIPDRYLLGPADWVDRNGRIEESLDGGTSWRPASEGLQVPWPRHMVERFHAAEIVGCALQRASSRRSACNAPGGASSPTWMGCGQWPLCQVEPVADGWVWMEPHELEDKQCPEIESILHIP
jgi:hypothetical protein